LGWVELCIISLCPLW